MLCKTCAFQSNVLIRHLFFKFFKYFADNKSCKFNTLSTHLNDLVWDREMLRIFLGIAKDKKELNLFCKTNVKE